jgi:hypothetical protein
VAVKRESKGLRDGEAREQKLMKEARKRCESGPPQRGRPPPTALEEG